MIHQLIATRRAEVSQRALLTTPAELTIFTLQVIGERRATPVIPAPNRHSTLRLPGCALVRGPAGCASVRRPANEH